MIIQIQCIRPTGISDECSTTQNPKRKIQHEFHWYIIPCFFSVGKPTQTHAHEETHEKIGFPHGHTFSNAQDFLTTWRNGRERDDTSAPWKNQMFSLSSLEARVALLVGKLSNPMQVTYPPAPTKIICIMAVSPSLPRSLFLQHGWVCREGSLWHLTAHFNVTRNIFFTQVFSSFLSLRFSRFYFVYCNQESQNIFIQK